MKRGGNYLEQWFFGSRLATLVGGCFVVVTFCWSRFAYYAKGVRFDTTTIDYFSQLLDPLLLRDRLAESLLYLHSQPPLFNLLTGLALKLSREPSLVLWPIAMAAGLYAALCLYFILFQLQVPRLLGALVAAAIAISPPFVLYENWYFYPHFDVAWLLGAIAWLAHSRGRPGWPMAISAAHLAGLSLTRSLFHPLFFALAAALTIALVAPGVRRRAALCFAVPGFAVFAWCAKNALIFGFFGTSSWGTRNIAKSVQDLVGPAHVATEKRLGHVSPAAGLYPFQPGEWNITAFALPERRTGVPAIDQTRKARSARPINSNHWSYPVSAHFYAEDTRRLLADYPATYLRGIVDKSLPLFFAPVDGDGFVAPNRAHIAALTQACDDFDQSGSARWLLAVGLACAALGACVAGRSERLALGLGFLAIVWVTGVGTFGDFGENYRFRYKVLWLSWVFATVGYFMAIRAAHRLIEEIRSVRS